MQYLIYQLWTPVSYFCLDYNKLGLKNDYCNSVESVQQASLPVR